NLPSQFFKGMSAGDVRDNDRGGFLAKGDALNPSYRVPSGHLHSHLADFAQGDGPETALQTPPWVLFAPIHHALQSKVSGCPRSFVCGWISSLPGLDSISIRSLWQASPKDRPLGRPACVTPIWHPATPGSMPSVSFQYVVTFLFQPVGLYSIVP